MQRSGLPIGLASEGSFVTDLFAGMFRWNMEFLIFIDDERDLEVVGIAQGTANFSHCSLMTGLRSRPSQSRRVLPHTAWWCAPRARTTRMADLRLVAQDLVNKMGSHCPACRTIGYRLVEQFRA